MSARLLLNTAYYMGLSPRASSARRAAAFVLGFDRDLHRLEHFSFPLSDLQNFQSFLSRPTRMFLVHASRFVSDVGIWTNSDARTTRRSWPSDCSVRQIVKSKKIE